MSTYTDLELHLDSSPLSRSETKRIKKAGGTYSKTLGYSIKRFVQLPAVERDLINELVRAHGGVYQTLKHNTVRRVTMIARARYNDGAPAWLNVQYVDPHSAEPPVAQFERKYQSARKQARERGLVR